MKKRSLRKPANRKGGFSLLDVIIGLLIASIIVVTSMDVLGSMFKVNTAVSERVEIHYEVKGLVEDLQNREMLNPEEASRALYSRMRDAGMTKLSHKNNSEKKSFEMKGTKDNKIDIVVTFYKKENMNGNYNKIKISSAIRGGGGRDEVVIWKDYEDDKATEPK